jgi:hypothetical protein
MAIEDGLELANELGGAALGPAGGRPGELDAGAAADVEAALRRYEASRAPRTARCVEQSLQVRPGFPS